MRATEGRSQGSELDGIQAKKRKKADVVFYSFCNEMQLVDRGGRGIEWAWVRNRNVDDFVGDTKGF